MLRRHVERFEVVVVVLELGAVDDEEAEPREDRLDALAQDRQRMAMTDPGRAARERDVDGAGRRPRGARRRKLLLEPRLDLDFELIDELTEAGTFLCRRLAERLQERRDEPAFAREVTIADGADVGLARRAGQLA